MEKPQFLSILQHYASTSPDEAKEIAALRAQYPYSQLLQTLTARASKDHGFQHQQRDLQVAAVYAADRNLLKDIITLQPEEPVHQIVSKHINAVDQVSATIDSVDVADVIMDDLERLSKLKSTFENLFMEYPRPEKKRQEFSEEKESSATPAAAETESIPVAVSSAKSKKARIIEMAKALNTTAENEAITSPKKKRRDKDGNPVDELIAEIQSSKQELLPENEKQKHQIEIINQFIRVQPSITSARDRISSSNGDLMPIKAGEFGDNIVSETLVEILVKQGKKDRAIEVLKKLIWKYPQKKAYFASQIEDLKK